MKRTRYYPPALLEVLEQRELLSITQVPPVRPVVPVTQLKVPASVVAFVTGLITEVRAPAAGSRAMGPFIPGTGVPGATATTGASSVNFSGGILRTTGWTGKLDLTNNGLILSAGDTTAQTGLITLLNDQLASGRNAGIWTGNGITSSTLNMSGSESSLALADAGDLGLSTYRGQMELSLNTTIVTVLSSGDPMGDGELDAVDLNLLAANWQKGV